MSRTQLETMVLSRGAQEELGIASGTLQLDGQVLRFRLDPGNLFERRGAIHDHLTGSYSVVITQRYQPDEPFAEAAQSTAPSIVELPDALRTVLAFASGRQGYVPHWLDRRTINLPHWSHTYPVAQPGAAARAAALTQEMAEDTGAVHYLFAVSGLLTCSNNASGCGRFFSVTPDGHWALHQAGQTRPLAAAPDVSDLAVTPVRRAAAQASSRARAAR